MIEKPCQEKLQDYEHDLEVYLIQNGSLRNAMTDAAEIIELCLEDADPAYIDISTLKMLADTLRSQVEAWKRF